MALNTLKCIYLTRLHFKGLKLLSLVLSLCMCVVVMNVVFICCHWRCCRHYALSLSVSSLSIMSSLLLFVAGDVVMVFVRLCIAVISWSSSLITSFSP